MKRSNEDSSVERGAEAAARASEVESWKRSIQKCRDDEKQECWSNLYPEWFKNHTVYLSTFEITVDNRVSFLIRNGVLERATPQTATEQWAEQVGYKRGAYQLARALSKDEWDIVTGVHKLPARKGLVIPTLLDLK